MDKFVSKAGRRLMRKDLRSLEAATLGLATNSEVSTTGNAEDGEESTVDFINPNSHVELFPRARLPSRQSFLELVNQERGLRESETNSFALLSLAQRRSPNALVTSKSIGNLALPTYRSELTESQKKILSTKPLPIFKYTLKK